MSNPIPREAPRDINHGRLFTESQIRASFVKWCDEYKHNPDAYQGGDSTDGEACADYLIQVMTENSH
ncbi:hypothetical protein NQ118_14685 [Enterobacter kobei]|uniref:Uncharacterized protein n=1 Tax=Enterobacter kobei TaxID=208224 RepID=A0A2J0PES7_9ENTR|nr:hypothetical protein [Enterobacter kobei]MCR2771287.1 hypothetical protein [Enterobacter kobei]PJD64006.1 hypothetical protein B9Q32_18225 [Enterobacter kobei]PJD66229.1 hypothetical protein B9Q37_25190 [Enterobacter kobei]PJD71062.1 hypothetical protein B9Q29_04090 [Enterobacter kobei]